MATQSGILAWENPMDRGAWQATVHGVTKSWTRLSNWTTTATVPVWLCRDKKTPLLSVEEELMDARCLLKNEEQCGLRPHLFLWLKNCSPLSSQGGTPFPPHLDFWEVSVTKKTLESPLDYKEIQPVHPKGNQSWIFTGRTDVEGETPILWSCEELTHLKRPWCWERLRAGGEGDDKGWDGWMASLTQWTWVWINSGVGDGQGGLAYCSPWGAKSWTRLSDWTELNLSLCLSLNYFCTKMGEPSALHPEMHSVVSLSVSSAGQQGIRF